MLSQRRQFVTKHFEVFASPLLFTAAVLIATAFQASGVTSPLQDTVRTIVSDDFVRNRPKGNSRRKATRKAGKATNVWFSGGRSYRLASSSSGDSARTEFAAESQVGLTFWIMRLRKVSDSRRVRPSPPGSSWIAERVEAETEFHEGDYLRLSIESPHAGYLYVIDRDWFRDGDLGETSLIFPLRGENNRLHAGKLIDIPSQDQAPFRATPKANQLGEILTIIITSSPLDLPISETPLPISKAQLSDWQEMWGGATKRFEMENGAGHIRTVLEEQAAARKGTRQLTRDDPPPQTIYVVTTRNRSAFLFNVKLSYAP
jgi:hypothetical protein